MNCILVVDIGTSSLRLAAVSDDAKIIHMGQKPYHPDYLDEYRIEQDPEVWFQSLDDLMVEAKAFLADHPPLAMVMTSQRSSVIPTTKEGKALRPALMWQDKRHMALCEALNLGKPDLQKICGAKMNMAYSGPKMAWIKENEPEIYEKTYKLFTPAEFIIYRLTGEARTDYTYASRSLLFDIRSLTWSDEILVNFGLDPNKLSEILPPGSIVGNLLSKWTTKWDLPVDLPLISAGGDQQCSALGLGVIAEGDYELTAGTGGYLMTMGSQVPDEIVGMSVNASAIPGSYVFETTMLTCSSAFDYFYRLFYDGVSYEALDEELRQVPPGSHGLVILPFFQGSGSPDWSPEKKADILGLSFSSGRAEITRACFEGLASELAYHVDLLTVASGHPVERISIAGGLTKNKTFSSMLVNLLDGQVSRPMDFEASLLGAWMSAAVCMKVEESFSSALDTVRKEYKVENLSRSEDLSASYEKVKARYLAMRASREGHEVRSL